ncbi:uncharacterized protein LOC143195774 isoform X2 [Rhynchophorus ferrugineus]|uniref:uncharacterized protein LOC143195774 isoform X2 n=1 Tax=Rhynchophorus ferrugineus TaxID=354439 RepID=UPI003FCEE59D
MEQIYVLELILYEINLYPDYNLKDVNEIGLSFKFAQRINFDIDTHFFTGPQIQETTNGSKITMNYGKTFLFTSKPSILRQLLLSDPFIITLYDGNKTIGQAQVHWKKEFAEMVKFFESLGIVKSTTFEEWHELKQNNKPVAKVNVFIRMSCFGSNVQTMFQIRRDGSRHNYLFRQRNESKIFKVEKHADDRIQPLVAPLYAGMTDGKSRSSLVNMKENVSLTELFATALDDKMSISQGVEDAVSICYRPSDNKFFNLLTLISADVKTHDKGTCVTIQKSHTRGDHGNRGGARDNLDVGNFNELTADKIARKLCGSSDCPAMKKFKEYGIGPLATGKNLGTLYGNDVEPHVTYGLSHMYGTFREYGPYGVFSRPKDEILPFVPLEDKKNVTRNSCGERSKPKKYGTWHSDGCPLRLRGGSDSSIINEAIHSSSKYTLAPKSPMIECKSVMDQFDSILAEYKKAIGPCRQATCPFAQTLAEDACKRACKDDKPPPIKEPSLISCDNDPCFVEECPYVDPKKRRYPAGCGSPKCAYTKYKLGLVDDDAELELQFLPPALGRNCGDPHCKYPLEPPLPPIHWDCPEPLPKGPCKNMNCPFLPAPLKKFKTKDLKKGPCGSPTCPYSLPGPCPAPTCPFASQPCPLKEKQPKQEIVCPKCLETTTTSEDSLCDNPECPYASKNETKQINDPIDDPKFKGEFQDCRNPECPYKKKECTQQPKKKKKNKKKKERKSKSKDSKSCNNPSCPYALPNPCSVPTCPFAMTPCPLAQKKQKQMCPECSESTSSTTDNLNKNDGCSQTKKNVINEPKKKTSDGLLKRDNQDCGNPECPYTMKENAKKARKKKRKEKKSKMEPCNNPSCPFAKPRPSYSVPTCPFTLRPCPNKPVQQPKCSESSSDNESVCSNPKCPSTKKKTTKSKQPKDKVGEKETGHCKNPECPYNKKEKAKGKECGKKQDTETCDSSDCRYNQKGELKDKKKEDADESSLCSNPQCTYAELKGNKKKQSSSESVCSNPECPYADYIKMKTKDKEQDSCPQEQNSVCSNEECPERKKRKKAKKQKEKVCIQPGCPYSKKKSKKTPCIDPLCPYLQPLPSCGIPNCPYEPIPIRYSCKDPNCPSKSVNFNKPTKTLTENLQQELNHVQQAAKPLQQDAIIRQQETNIYENTTTTVYEEAMVCIKDDPCDNPDCDMQAIMEAMGDNSFPFAETNKRRMRKKGKFVYSIGDEYPGTKAGHKECMVPVFKVPPNMGWLWNIYTPTLGLKPRRGWRPGALTKSIAQRIKEHRNAKGLGLLAVPNFRKDGKHSNADLEPKVTPRPTLQIQKRENAYWITMNPLKDPSTLVENEDPYMDCTPMTFKITKNSKKEEYCACDGEEPIEESSSSSDSELDIEFTPPAGIIHPERFKKKPNVASCEAQYDPKDVAADKSAEKKKGEKKGKDKKGKDKKDKGGKGDEKKGGDDKDKDKKGKDKDKDKGKDKKDDKKETDKKSTGSKKDDKKKKGK